MRSDSFVSFVAYRRLIGKKRATQLKPRFGRIHDRKKIYQFLMQYNVFLRKYTACFHRGHTFDQSIYRELKWLLLDFVYSISTVNWQKKNIVYFCSIQVRFNRLINWLLSKIKIRYFLKLLIQNTGCISYWIVKI